MAHSHCVTYRLLNSMVSFVHVLILLSISSNIWCAFGLSDNIFSVEVVNEFPHDPTAFTQGLLYGGNDTLFESTGLYRNSSVRRIALNTGKIEAIEDMQQSYFGEGLTLLSDRLFQVNWMTKTGFIYDRYNLHKIKTFINPMKDGWGLATDGKFIYGSDGTSTLYAIDPRTFRVVEKHTVKYKGLEVSNLNELEYVNGEVWANVWQITGDFLIDSLLVSFVHILITSSLNKHTDCIARLSCHNSSVQGWMYVPNLREGLIAAGYEGIDVLNGIAWDGERSRIFLTGKLWPKLFEIKLKPVTSFQQDIRTLCILNTS